MLPTGCFTNIWFEQQKNHSIIIEFLFLFSFSFSFSWEDIPCFFFFPFPGRPCFSFFFFPFPGSPVFLFSFFFFLFSFFLFLGALFYPNPNPNLTLTLILSSFVYIYTKDDGINYFIPFLILNAVFTLCYSIYFTSFNSFFIKWNATIKTH
jgi:hypothetical protein